MSAQSVARWNAIPMVREEEKDEEVSSMKRPRAESDEESEDNVSLVSRTPSPPPTQNDDKSVHRAPAEIITVDTKIKSTNKGFVMLSKLGWSEGQPLGLSGEGRVDPIPFHIKNDFTGLGKTSQDFRMIETTVAQRRVLDSERQRKETEGQRRAREDIAARRAAVKSEITDTLRPFYCALCDKQFQNVAQYDEHTNSYAHHHKARLQDIHANARPVLQEEVEKRKEKERKREEKEFRKLAKAAGIKMAKPPAAASTTPMLAPVVTADTATTSEMRSGGFRKAGWATVNASAETSVGRTGRSSVDSTTPRPPSPPPRGDLKPSPPPATQPSHRLPDAPFFRTGGWTTLDTGSSDLIPLAPSDSAPLAPSPPRPVFPVPPPPSEEFPPPPPPQSLPSSGFRTGDWAPIPSQQAAPTPTAPKLIPSSPATPVGHAPTSAPHDTKSGWQQWKQNKNFRRK